MEQFSVFTSPPIREASVSVFDPSGVTQAGSLVGENIPISFLWNFKALLAPEVLLKKLSRYRDAYDGQQVVCHQGTCYG
jgi:hypothetical protein